MGILIYKLSGPKIQGSDPFYKEYVKFQTYYCMLKLAKYNLEVGKHPIPRGNYTKEIRKGYLEEIVFPFFKEVNNNTKIIFCYANEEIIKKRLIERSSHRDIQKLESEESWKKFMLEQPPIPQELKNYDHIKIDTTKPLEQNLKEALEYLKS